MASLGSGEGCIWDHNGGKGNLAIHSPCTALSCRLLAQLRRYRNLVLCRSKCEQLVTARPTLDWCTVACRLHIHRPDRKVCWCRTSQRPSRRTVDANPSPKSHGSPATIAFFPCWPGDALPKDLGSWPTLTLTMASLGSGEGCSWGHQNGG